MTLPIEVYRRILRPALSESTAEIRAGAGSSRLMSDAAISPIRHGPCRQGRIRGT
jgi:hypothetical protein